MAVIGRMLLAPFVFPAVIGALVTAVCTAAAGTDRPRHAAGRARGIDAPAVTAGAWT
jgi:hypothetical protein